jgi:molecular chaperone DnaK
VSAMDEKSQMKQAIIVTPSAGLSSEEIEAVIEEAKRLQEADSQEKEITLLKNRADDLAASVRKSYSEFGWMLDAPSQEQIKNALLAPSKSISQERDISPVVALHEALSELEAAAEVLSRAIFSIPDEEVSPKVEAAPENKPAGEDSEKGTS